MTAQQSVQSQSTIEAPVAGTGTRPSQPVQGAVTLGFAGGLISAGWIGLDWTGW